MVRAWQDFQLWPTTMIVVLGGILFGSGLIAGESILGILLAVLIWRNAELPDLSTHWLVSVLLFIAVCVYFGRLARRRNG